MILAQILERGEVAVTTLGKHQGRAHKLAIEPGSPHIFYTCGEDGLVQHVSYDFPLLQFFIMLSHLFGEFKHHGTGTVIAKE